MRIEAKVFCHPEGPNVQAIRTMICIEATEKRPEGYNPLTETKFNDLLDEIVQQAFDAGLRYQSNK